MRQNEGWREKTRVIIFEADTPAGKAFDILLIVSILVSVIAVLLDSVTHIRQAYGILLYQVEWFFTILFTIEYALRLASIGKPGLYARSFFGVVDLMAIAPTYLSLFIPGTQYLLVIRILRVLRIFRILKFARHIREATVLMRALSASRRKITIFLFTILTLVVIMGSLMYLIEGEANGFTSIPVSIYWAIVTLTTVGYGDITPKTVPGQMMASVVMIMGYAIIAVPTGIVTVELGRAARESDAGKFCSSCSAEGLDNDSSYCKHCGNKL